jgi:hypothetical protein
VRYIDCDTGKGFTLGSAAAQDASEGVASLAQHNEMKAAAIAASFRTNTGAITHVAPVFCLIFWGD